MPVTTVARTATPGSGFESNETNSPGGANSLDAPAPAFDMTRLVEAVCSQLRRDLAVLRERRGQSR
jgi:hypothetical protein